MHEISPPVPSDPHEDPKDLEHAPGTIAEHPYSHDEEALVTYAMSREAGLDAFIAKREITDPAIDAEDVF